MMKSTRWAIVAGLLFAGSFISPPGQLRAQFRIGGTAGINIATLSVTSADSYWDPSRMSSYVGPVLGGIMEVGLSERLFLRIEPTYIQKGTRRTFYEVSDAYTGLPLAIEAPFKLEFLQMPVTLGVQIGEGPLRPYLFAGPNVGYLLTHGYSGSDIAFDAGIGVEYELSANRSILLEARYSAGLNNLNTEDPGAPELRSRGIQPLLGVLFKP
jgi:opacity protein-like surface antigen